MDWGETFLLLLLLNAGRKCALPCLITKSNHLANNRNLTRYWFLACLFIVELITYKNWLKPSITLSKSLYSAVKLYGDLQLSLLRSIRILLTWYLSLFLGRKHKTFVQLCVSVRRYLVLLNVSPCRRLGGKVHCLDEVKLLFDRVIQCDGHATDSLGAAVESLAKYFSYVSTTCSSH